MVLGASLALAVRGLLKRTDLYNNLLLVVEEERLYLP